MTFLQNEPKANLNQKRQLQLARRLTKGSAVNRLTNGKLLPPPGQAGRLPVWVKDCNALYPSLSGAKFG